MDIWIDIPSPIEAVLPRRVVIPFDRPLRLGRNTQSIIVLSSTSDSRCYCEIGRDGCGAWVERRNSQRGIFINDVDDYARGNFSRLSPNDVMTVASIRTRVGWDFEVAPNWLAWESGLLVALAERVQEDRDYATMPILADALEDAGCSESEILAHLRGPGPHVRECWVIEALLNPKGRKPEG